MQTKDSPSAEECNELFIKACEAHQNGSYQEAQKGYQKLLGYFPEAPMVNYNLGLLLLDTDRYEDAVDAFEQAAKGDPEDCDIIFNLAFAQKKAGNMTAAIKAYNRVLGLDPANIDAMYNLAGCYRDKKLYDLAINMYEKLLKNDSHHLSACNNLAYVYQRQGDSEKAVAAYKRVLELDPEHSSAAHMLAALSGEHISSAPDDYVQEVFDSYSDHYEKSLVEELEYHVPEKIRDILLAGANWKVSFARGLDLGCGTGLGGEALKSITKSLDGVDLAEKMVEIAREKNIYSSLHVTGINEFLTKSVGPYDFVLAADVFGYVGDLRETFEQLHGRTTADVLFTFSTETCSGSDYALRKTGRFAHSVDYIQTLAGKTGWRVCELQSSRLRKELDQWIEGNLWFMVKAGL